MNVPVGYELDLLIFRTIATTKEVNIEWFNKHHKMGFWNYSTHWLSMIEFIESRLVPCGFEITFEESEHHGSFTVTDQGNVIVMYTCVTVTEAFARCLVELAEKQPCWISVRSQKTLTKGLPPKNTELDLRVAKEALHTGCFYIKDDELREYEINQFKQANEGMGTYRYSSDPLWMRVAIRDTILKEGYTVIMTFTSDKQSTFTLKNNVTGEIYETFASEYITEAFSLALIKRCEIDPLAFRRKALAQEERFKRMFQKQ